MYQKPKNYSQPFSYKVPNIDNYKLPTQESVWDVLDKKASAEVVIPDNIEEIRERHKKKLKQLIKKKHINKSFEKVLKSSGYAKNHLILDSIKNGYYLGLKVYDNEIDDVVYYYYYKQLILHKYYLTISNLCSSQYSPDDFNFVKIPTPKKQLSKKGIETIKEFNKEIENFSEQKVKTQNLVFIKMFDNKISSLEKYVEAIQDNPYFVRNYKPVQAMKIFLRYAPEIEFASISFLKKVITYHLQQQKTKKKESNKESRKFQDRARKKVPVSKSDIKYFIVNQFFKNNPNSTLKLAKEELGFDEKTIKKYRDKFNNSK